MNIVALLTGRGNNTLKDKNILNVLGSPLLSYPCRAAQKVKSITHYYASSDDDKILDAAAQEGYNKIIRPKNISAPDSQHIDAILHAVNFMEEQGVFPDILVVLLANSVTVQSEWIEQSINHIIEDPSITSSVPAYKEQGHHPFRAKRVNQNGLLEPFFDFKNKEISTNRQDLEDCYFLCHNFWTLNVKSSLRVWQNTFSVFGQPPWKFLGDKIKYIPVQKGFDVHSLEDIKASEEWIIENKIREEVRKQIVEFSHENCPAQKRWLGTDKEDTDY